MDGGTVATVSLLAAFLAGIVALFAPCCITFLLPAYLGSVFKERKQVLLMTLVFGLGIFVVLLPAVMGISAMTRFLFRYHDLTYYLGGVVMIGVGLLALYGFKLPMPNFSRQTAVPERPDVLSIFTLGVFSGLASACCAPVLVGVMTLTLLAPSFWTGLLVGAFYVLGMVTPLLISGYFIDARKLFSKAVFGKKIGRFVLSNIIAAAIFIPMGVLVLYLTFTGKLSMEATSHYSDRIRDAAVGIQDWLDQWGPREEGEAREWEEQTMVKGDVEARAKPIRLEPGETAKFRLRWDTHSTELDFEVPEVAILADDRGKVYGQASWEGSPPGGHHRNGETEFTIPLDKKIKSVKLEIGEFGIFEWVL